MGIIKYTKQEMLGFFHTIEHQVMVYLEQEHVEDTKNYNYSDYGFKFTATGETIYTRIMELKNNINTATLNTILTVNEDTFHQWVDSGYENTVPWKFDTIK